jgi:hypothetical protein
MKRPSPAACRRFSPTENKLRGNLMINKTLVVILPIMAILSTLLTTQSNAEEDTGKSLGAVTCRDVLLASGEDRDGFVLVLHGYILGESKQLTYDADVLAIATDHFLEACIKSPDASALSTMSDQIEK